MKREKQWCIIYTNTGYELKVLNALQKRQIECFCLMNTPAAKVKHQHVVTPSLPNYIFVHISPHEQATIRQVNGVVNFMFWLGDHITVNEEDIFLLKELIEKYQIVSTEKINVNTTISTKMWETAPVKGNNSSNAEEHFIKVFFSPYGFAVTAKERNINVRVININANRNQEGTSTKRIANNGSK
jgi:hypothetical protein